MVPPPLFLFLLHASLRLEFSLALNAGGSSSPIVLVTFQALGTKLIIHMPAPSDVHRKWQGPSQSAHEGTAIRVKRTACAKISLMEAVLPGML